MIDVNAEDGNSQPASTGYPDDPNEVIGTDADGNEIIWDDILTTARENGMTVEEVLRKLQGK